MLVYQRIYIIYPPTPDSSRGSASEDQGLAFMWQKQHHPCFTAMVFWLCETGPLTCEASPAVQEGGRMEGLRLVSRQFRESNVWQYGLLAAGPIRTSLPWCFGSARPAFVRKLCWQCRKAGEWKV